MSRDLPNETDLTPYNAIEVIGEGGTGRVYLAHRVGSTKPVALKVFHASFIGQAGGASLAVKHAAMLRKLGHPRMVLRFLGRVRVRSPGHEAATS